MGIQGRTCEMRVNEIFKEVCFSIGKMKLIAYNIRM